ncbi:MAG: hypothetical protein ACI9UN_004245 [Granulosicoccus sp.]|jgi:hypothetical protein
MTSSFTQSVDCRNVKRIKLFATQCAGLALLLICIGNSGVFAQSIQPGDLSPFEVEFEVGNNMITAGTASLLLEKKDELWHYSLTTKPRGVFKLAGKGNISEVSTFKVVTNDDLTELQPQTYRFRQDKEKRRAVDVTFDWDNKTLEHTYRGNNMTEAFTDPILDRLTVTLLIMNALRHDFQNAELPIFDTDKIKAVEFVYTGPETLKTRLGDIETVRVINRNATGGSRETTTWFAPSLDYLPVKIEHRKRGDLVARLSLIRMKNTDNGIQFEIPPPAESDDLVDSSKAK